MRQIVPLTPRTSTPPSHLPKPCADLPEVCSRSAEARSRSAEARSRPPEVTSHFPRPRSRKPEVRSHPPEVRSRCSEAKFHTREVASHGSEATSHPSEACVRPPEALSHTSEASANSREARADASQVCAHLAEVSVNSREVRSNKPLHGTSDDARCCAKSANQQGKLAISLSELDDFHADSRSETKESCPKLSEREKGGTPLWPITSLAGLSRIALARVWPNTWGCCGHSRRELANTIGTPATPLAEAGVIEPRTPAPNEAVM